MKKMIQPEALKVGANRISANDARSVKLDFAPMEGITGYVFRQAHAVIYGGVDRYYSRFIAPGPSHKLTSRERNDILPEHNQGLCLIPLMHVGIDVRRKVFRQVIDAFGGRFSVGLRGTGGVWI